jgi:hypothetical protein
MDWLIFLASPKQGRLRTVKVAEIRAALAQAPFTESELLVILKHLP